MNRIRAASEACYAAEGRRKLGLMKRTEWKARTKRELMIEVWEHLDCESVGARELEVVTEAVRERFGEGAVEGPARMARVLADEGAELRHAEVLDADVRWRTQDPYEAMFRNVLKFSTFEEAAHSIRRLDNLRKQFQRKGDRAGLRRVHETVLKGKQRAQMIARNPAVNERKRAEKKEMAEWFTVWLNQPEIFEDWLALRLVSKDFRARFREEEAGT
ncbi:MAG: hypothetical protein QOC99_4049 [Acidobacteriota bacterium]|jgi:hypothetical protein|nr:hypothetical protein [Acidobacteriota bacterium]